MQTLAAATLAMQGKAVYDSAQALYNGNVGGIKISVNLSNNTSKSQRTQQGQNVSASSVIAGGDIHVQATGAQDSDLNIISSRLSAGRDIRLAADRNILLRAAENTATQSSKENGGGWSVGVGLAWAVRKTASRWSWPPISSVASQMATTACGATPRLKP